MTKAEIRQVWATPKLKIILDYYEQQVFWSRKPVTKYIKGTKVTLLLNGANDEFVRVIWGNYSPQLFYFFITDALVRGRSNDYYVIVNCVSIY